MKKLQLLDFRRRYLGCSIALVPSCCTRGLKMPLLLQLAPQPMPLFVYSNLISASRLVETLDWISKDLGFPGITRGKCGNGWAFLIAN